MIVAWTVLDKFHPKPTEAAFSTVFTYKFRPKVDSDAIFGKVIDNVSMDVPIKFGDSRSNGFRDIRGTHFVSNERANIGEAYPNSASAISTKNGNTTFTQPEMTSSIGKKNNLFLNGPEYDQIKLRSGVNGLRCRKRRKTNITSPRLIGYKITKSWRSGLS